MQYFIVRTAVFNYILRKQIHIGPTQLANNNIPFNFKIILKSKKNCKDMYKLLNEKDILPKSQIKWIMFFGNENLDWHQICEFPPKVAKIRNCAGFSIEYFTEFWPLMIYCLNAA